MDSKLYKQVAQFKVKCKKLGLEFEVVRFIDDREYARAVLSNLDRLDDDETLLLGLVLREALGLAPPLTLDPPPEPVSEREPEPPADKYRFGARG